MFAGDAAVAGDGVGVHLAEPPGLSDAAPLGDVLEDRLDLLGREPRVE
jgi:glyoxylase-like metal-dependent hydrolase (beta-lactamase superfamily II)